ATGSARVRDRPRRLDAAAGRLVDRLLGGTRDGVAEAHRARRGTVDASPEGSPLGLDDCRRLLGPGPHLRVTLQRAGTRIPAQHGVVLAGGPAPNPPPQDSH